MAKLFTILRTILYCYIFSVALLWFMGPAQTAVQVVHLLCAVTLAAACTYIIMNRHKYKVLFAVQTVCTLVLFTAVGAVLHFSASIGAYQVDPVSSDFFQGKHVMVLVPHQDDDVSLAGGLAELFVHHGSKVSVVYSTNGDYKRNQCETRFQEAISVAEQMGIPKEDVHFLGFGDDWQPLEADGETYYHIYNSPDADLLWTSFAGHQKTYGTSSKDCEKDYEYTRRNFVDSIQSVILELRPDVIYAVDYDHHRDHIATSLLFEEAMCNILRTTDYRPKVYKGFCYRTAWFSEPDFLDRKNILSTVFPTEFGEEPVYPWEERVRVPVYPGTLNRFLSRTAGFQQLRTYKSQNAREHAIQVVNGDKVFWERRTDSLLYNAEILMGEEKTVLLNDFKLMDSYDVTKTTMDDGVVPVLETIRVNLPQAEKFGAVSLHDDPHEENQILGGYLLLPSGETCEFGALNDNGTATYIPLPEDAGEITSFDVIITEFRGIPGLTEIGAFAEEVPAADQDLQYFMFVDEEDNVVYDYYMDTDTQTFELYTYPGNCEVRDADFQITMEGSDCSYSFEDGNLQVYCPESAECQITVRYGDAVTCLSVSHPGRLKSWLIDRTGNLDYLLNVS